MKPTPLALEKIWPYLAAALGLAGWWYLGEMRFPEAPDNLLAATGNTVAVLVGFLAASKAIVLSISESRVFERLKAAGYNDLLFAYFYQGIAAGIAFLAISIFGFFYSNKAPPDWYKFTWVYLAFLSFFCFIRVVKILFKLLRWV